MNAERWEKEEKHQSDWKKSVRKRRKLKHTGGNVNAKLQEEIIMVGTKN
jgi:hypothetical protein